jgi:hypothetical protein
MRKTLVPVAKIAMLSVASMTQNPHILTFHTREKVDGNVRLERIAAAIKDFTGGA